jgi:hypothetical protein
LKRVFRDKAWCKQWVSFHKEVAEKSFGVTLGSDEAYYEAACRTLGFAAQHLIGGFLCFPSAYGPPSELAFSLARHGALCEMGCEMQDLLVRGWQCTFEGAEGRAKNPARLLLFVCLHHSMGCSLVVPMNLYYPRNRSFHEFVFLLQGSAGVATLMRSYGFTLDTSTRDGLLGMQFSVVFVWLAFLWSRVLRFAHLSFVLVFMLLKDGRALLSASAVAVALAMGCYNFIGFLDVTRKLLKFGLLKHTSGDRPISEVAAEAGELLRPCAPPRASSGVRTGPWFEVDGPRPCQTPTAPLASGDSEL